MVFSTGALLYFVALFLLTRLCLAGVTKDPHLLDYSATSTTTITTATSGTTIASTTSETTTRIDSSTQNSSDSGQHSEGDPEIRFGNFFHVSFPSTVAEQFFGCLCNPVSLDCSVQYKLRDNQTSNDFPFLYRVLSHEQKLLPGNDSDLYRPYFICDVLNFVPGQDITCRRQLASEDTCETTGKCQAYTANFTLRGCAMGCIELAWLSAFTVPITYTDIDPLVLISENGTCPDSNTWRDGEPEIDQDDDDDNERIGSPIILGIILGCVGLVVVVAALVAWALCRRVRTRRKSQAIGESSASKTTPPMGAHNRGFGEEDEEDQYQEIYDIPDGGRIPEEFDEPDEDGYNVIHDENRAPNISKFSHDNGGRSLPALPDTQNRSSLDPMISDDTSTSLDPTSLPPQYNSGDFRSFSENSPNSPSVEPNMQTDSSSSSASSAAMLLPPRTNLDSSTRYTTADIPSDKLPSVEDLTESRPNPKPHKLPTHMSHYDYLGLVNIQCNYPGLRESSQFMLVRNTSGDMELVNPQDDDDTPAMTDLCSVLQIISLRDGSLCVLGVLEEPPSDDYHQYFRILKFNNDQHKNNGDLLGNKPSPGQIDDRLDQPLRPTDSYPDIQAIYLGPLALESGYTVVTTQNGHYLSQADLDTHEQVPDDGTYLRVLDIDEANLRDKDGDYLTVLDV